MKYPIPFARLAVISGLIAVVGALSLRAEFIQPVAVLASNGEATQDALINGLGLDNPGPGSVQSIHSRENAEMWSVVGSIKADAVFDLGKTVDLTKVYVWNFNVTDNTDRGMKDVEVLVSPDANMTNANFTAIAVVTLKEGGEAAQSFNVVGTNVRLVKLKGITNWGHGWSVGLAEVRFESGDITGEVPSVIVANPHEGDVIPFGTDIMIDARVTDRDNNLLKVEFFDGDTKLAEKTASPYTLAVKAPAKGDHAFRVVATDRSNFVGWVTVNTTVREFVADRIVQIDDTSDEGTSLNQIVYTGTWNLAQGNPNDPRFKNNDHYSDVRNAYFEVKFKGVKIDVFATVASHHGSAIATIDGGTEYTVSYKTPQRNEQVLVWSSPILPNREHVLRIRVFGNGVVTADRFDVHVSDKPEVEKAALKKIMPSLSELIVEVEDAGRSVVDPATVKLSVDGALVTSSVVKAGSVTTLTYKPATPFPAGSSHTLQVETKDSTGAALTLESPFVLPKPFFPLTGLGGPGSTAGKWGLRQIWNAGRADAIVSAVEIALQATQPGFTGKIHDTTAAVINFAKTANPGSGGYFPNDEPLPAETQGLTESDYVIVARARVRIPRAGDWTIGVHSDEGFGLRFMGAPFASVSGNGVRDDNFPEFMAYQTNTGDSSTRGILKGIAAGVYEIEFIAWERAGASYFEIYAAEGAFENDADTDLWQLIGGPGGLEIVAASPKVTALALARAGDRVTIDFATSAPAGQYQLQESADLKSWQPVVAATFEKTANNNLRASVGNVAGNVRFYRVVLLGVTP
ncbi:MAG: Ig-like domain-containing protein [Verrucomicrobia bacterium]|nr:Ig-like domain-containing protein [Verrucomicrobiota bacterium]